MSVFDLDALEAVAKAATPGEWHPATTGVESGDHWSVIEYPAMLPVCRIPSQDGSNEDQREPDARHIATFDPPTVLALIAELRDSRARIAEVEAERDRALSRAQDFEGRYETAHASRMHAEDCYHRELARAEAAERTAAALAEVIEQVRSREFAALFLSEWVKPYFGDDARDAVACVQRSMRAALAAAPTPPACDSCNDTGRVPWMVEGDPHGYQECDEDGTVPCPDCAPTPPAEAEEARDHG